MACITPFNVKLKMENRTVPVPCGKCPDCRKRRVSGWSFRLMYEDKRATSALFITLTYDTTNVPITRNGFMTVDKRDVQLFIKRLRKAEAKIHNNAIKYYLAAEYGGRTKRPHYHAIIFNVSGHASIENTWLRGVTHYGTVTGASVGYCLKYMDKPKRVPEHRNDDRNAEFGLMSKGIGLGYITDSITRWHHAERDNRMYILIEDGKKISMPRYFKDKIYAVKNEDGTINKEASKEVRKQIQFANLPKIREREEKERQRLAEGNNLHDKVQSDLRAFAKAKENYKKDKL